MTVRIVGGGPAGASAALSALRAGAKVRLFEKSRFPRHKVCGEFLSPESLQILRDLDMERALQAMQPAQVRRSVLHFPPYEKEFILPEPGLGLSRYVLDALLLDTALRRGADVIREQVDVKSVKEEPGPVVLAHGRRGATPAGNRDHRLFGFKAHFEGVATDAVELFFFNGCYVGVIPIEQGKTNVCGLGPERVLHQVGFDHDVLIAACPALRNRLKPVSRRMDWLSVGPLVFENRFRQQTEADVYPAGDALSFVDPFTGSGLLAALRTGLLAGEHAVKHRNPDAYLRGARQALESPFFVSRFMRFMIGNGWAETLMPWIPGKMLFQWTRPQ